MADDEISVMFNIVVEYKGVKVLDHHVFQILKAIKEKGSILGATRSLGMPYSKIYETISRIERVTGRKVVNSKCGGRGGGGSSLTDFGEKLLSIYESALARLTSNGFNNGKPFNLDTTTSSIAYSYDPVLSRVLSMVTADSPNASTQRIQTSSFRALAMLSLELVDVACLHLYDPDTNSFNTPYIEKLRLDGNVKRIGGYLREIVFVYRPGLEVKHLDDLIQKLLSGELVLANMNRGSGTRIILEHTLRTYAKKLNIDLSRVRGLGTEIHSHEDIAKYVKSGKADTGLTLRYIADRYGLGYVRLMWEVYECYALKNRENIIVKKIENLMRSKDFVNYISRIPGYRPL
uniref:LysR family transcriptional regulator n=1 Tax=Ignisphaera aggregans TaxID=334771 RepID=A0A7C2ZNR7_9CREN